MCAVKCPYLYSGFLLHLLKAWGKKTILKWLVVGGHSCEQGPSNDAPALQQLSSPWCMVTRHQKPCWGWLAVAPAGTESKETNFTFLLSQAPHLVTVTVCHVLTFLLVVF